MFSVAKEEPDDYTAKVALWPEEIVQLQQYCVRFLYFFINTYTFINTWKNKQKA